MKQVYPLLLLLLILGCPQSWGQQDAFYALYRQHLNMLNPAVNGLQESPFLNMTLRSQWSGIEDAPETQVLSYATPTPNEKVSLGFNIINDVTFVETQTQFFVSYAYMLQLTPAHKLFMGLQAGANAFRVNAQDLDTFDEDRPDPNLMNYSRFNPNIGAGLYLNHERYFLSLSAPRILNSERYKNTDGLVTSASDKVHLYTSAGLRFSINDQWTFSPSFMGRYVRNAPALWTLNTSFIFKDVLDFGLEYNINSGLGGTIMLGGNKAIGFGYAYSGSKHKDLQQLSNGTHEAFLRIKLGKSQVEKQLQTVSSGEDEKNVGSRNNRKQKKTIPN